MWLTHVPPHGLWRQARISCMNRGGHPGSTQGQGRNLRTAALGKGPDRFGGQIPASHVVTKHCTLAAMASTADVDALSTRQIPTKVIIGQVSNEAFVGAWQKNLFNFAHMDLNSACLVVDGCPLPAQPWQPDFTQGLYA